MASMTPTVRRISFTSPAPSPFVPGSSARRKGTKEIGGGGQGGQSARSRRRGGGGGSALEPSTVRNAPTASTIYEDSLQSAGRDILAAFQNGDITSAAAFATQMRRAVEARIGERDGSGEEDGNTSTVIAKQQGLELERDTWLLAERSMRSEDMTDIGDMATRIAHAAAFGVEVKPGLKRLRTVERWLEDLAAQVLDARGGARLAPLDDPAYRYLYSAPSLRAPIDYYDLDDVEQRVEQRVGRELWLVLRAGRVEDAEEMCRDIGQSWRAACEVAAGRGLSWISANGKVGGARQSWKRIAQKIALDQASPMSAYERAMIAILAGAEGPALAVCQNYEERLWARASCSVHRSIEAHVDAVAAANAADESGAGQVEEDVSAEELLNLFFHTAGMAEGGEEVFSVRKVRAYLSLGRHMQRPEVLALLQEMQSCASGNQCSAWVLRFYAHVSLLLRLCGVIDESDGTLVQSFEAVLTSYIRRIMGEISGGEEMVEAQTSIAHIDRTAYDLVVHYAAQLREGNAVQICAQLLQEACYSDVRHPLASTTSSSSPAAETRSAVCLQKCATCFDREMLRKICNACVDRVWEECLPDSADVARGVKEVTLADQQAIFVLNILVQEEVKDVEELLRRSSRLARRFGITQKTSAARILLESFPQDLLQSLAPGVCLNERHELECWHAYMHSLARHRQWQKHFYANRPLPPPEDIQRAALATPGAVAYELQAACNVKMTAYLQRLEEYDRVCARLRAIAVEALQGALTMPGGWMRDVAPAAHDDRDPFSTRTEELRVVRAICVPTLVAILHKVLHDSDLHDEAAKLVDLVADERVLLYQDFSPADMRAFLLRAQQSFTLLAQSLASEEPSRDAAPLFTGSVFEDFDRSGGEEVRADAPTQQKMHS